MFRQRFVGGGTFLLSTAMLWTAGSVQGQVFSTIAVSTPRSFSFYTFPANYSPYFIPGNTANYGGDSFGFGPSFSPYGAFSTTFDLLPPSSSTAPGMGQGGGVPAAARAAMDTTASIELRVPPDAKVWLQGEKMKQEGIVRRFISPPFDPAQGYTYDLRVSWTENGRQLTRDEHLSVRAGDHQGVTFLAALMASARPAPKGPPGK